MRQLLKIEWLKVKNYKTFWVLSALYLLSIWGINYIVFVFQRKVYANKEAGDMAKLFLGGPPYAFPKVWQMTTNVSSYLLFIAGLIMIILVTNEFTFKTHRQNVIDGVTRTQFIVTKLVCGFIIALLSTVFVFFTALYFGLVEESSTISFSDMQYLFYFFLQALNYCWLAIFISLLVKRSGIAIGVFFLYTIVLENVLVQMLNFYFDGAGRYLPIQSSDELIPVPVFESLQKQISWSEISVYTLIVLVCMYLAAWFFISKRKFETDDL
jgi:ABC-2 type transport system permease protein